MDSGRAACAMKTYSESSQPREFNTEPPPARPPRRRRRTQKERSAETRALLLDVTIECLAELGYAGATAQVIAERAGLSRGAQLHHFGTKMALVTQAMEHLFERRLVEFRRGIEEIPAGDDFTTAALDLLWSMVAGPAGHAYLELVIAARTDEKLREAMIAVTRRMDEQVELMFNEIFESPSGVQEMFEVGWTALFALMEGLAMEKVVRPDDEVLDKVLLMLKQFAPMVIAPKRR